jgi:hypothetical protein
VHFSSGGSSKGASGGITGPSSRVLLGDVLADCKRIPNDDRCLVVLETRHFSRWGKSKEFGLAKARFEEVEFLLEGDVESFEEDPWSHGPRGVTFVANEKCIRHFRSEVEDDYPGNIVRLIVGFYGVEEPRLIRNESLLHPILTCAL